MIRRCAWSTSIVVAKSWGVRLLFAATLILMVVSEKRAVAEESIADLKDKIVSYRSKIHHGKLQLKTIATFKKQPNARYDQKEITVDLYFDGQELRADRHYVELMGGNPTGVFDEQRVIANRTYIYNEVGKMHVPVEMGTFEEDKQHELNRLLTSGAIDPRVCGLLLQPATEWAGYGLEDAVRILNPLTSPPQTMELAGEEILIGTLSRQIEGGTGELTVWIAPRKDYAVLKIERLLPAPGSSRRIEASYRQFPGQIWFPSQVVFEEWTGEEVDYREVTSIKGTFAEPVDASAFTLAALDLSPGRRVRNSGEMMLWDGEHLVPETTLAQGDSSDAPGKLATWRSPLLMVNALVVAALAILLYLKWFRKLGVEK